MENNIFKKACGSINYNTYQILQNSLSFSAISLSVVNELISQYPMINNSIDALSVALWIAHFGMFFSNGKEYTKDVNEIRKLYKEFLKNYNKLNKIFNLENPIEISSMFNYLLYKGYLSVNKEFEFSDNKKERAFNSLRGVNVISGQGVCRHISAMLTDILNEDGIESSQLGVYCRLYSINIEILEQPKYTKEELVNWVRTHIPDDETYKALMTLIDELVDKRNQNIEIVPEMIEDKNILKRKVGNHAISFAFKDGFGYFLDPTIGAFYRMSESDKDVLYSDDGDEFPIRLTSSIVLDGSKDYLKVKKILAGSFSTVSKEEEQVMVKETLDKCKNNEDVFEQFYTENSELYDDISNKQLCLKNHKSILK